MLATTLATLVAALAAPQDPQPSKPATAADLMQAARAKLKTVGYEVPTAIEPVERSNREVVAGVPSYFQIDEPHRPS